MIKVPHQIQIHLSHACNFTCEGCTHFSNYGHPGFLSLDLAEQWFSVWNTRIEPDKIALLGGEPTLNKNLTEFVYLTRKYWKNSKIEIVTNTSFLNLHPNLPKSIKETNSKLCVSFHHKESSNYLQKLKTNYELIKEWKKEYDINFEVWDSTLDWIPQTIGYGDGMLPYEDNDPEKSWRKCKSNLCVQLHENKLWKCPPLAYLPMQAKKFNLSEKWDNYLKYKPLESDSTDEEVLNFFKLKWESYCSMCPAYAEPYMKPDPTLPLKYWKNINENN
jgi:organic radical activating enzyme